MARLKLNLQGDAYRKVLGYTFRGWMEEPWRLLAMVVAFMLATIADVLTPLYAGNLVTAVSNTTSAAALNPALWAFGTLIGLGLFSVVIRQWGFMVLIKFTLK